MIAPAWPHGARAACAFTFDLDAETRILDLLREAELDAIAGHARGLA